MDRKNVLAAGALVVAGGRLPYALGQNCAIPFSTLPFRLNLCIKRRVGYARRRGL